MAQYKYPQFLQKNEHAEFDTDYSPGSSAPNAGIYRCMGCGREIGIAQATGCGFFIRTDWKSRLSE
jgi:hypothetical protein